MQISRIRLSGKQSTRNARQRQRLQAKLAKMRVEADALGRTIAALTATAEMNPQTLLHIIVEIPVRFLRITDAEVRAPTLERSIDALNHLRNRHEAVPTAGHNPQHSPLLQQSFLRRNHTQMTLPSTIPVTIVSGNVYPRKSRLAPVCLRSTTRVLSRFSSNPIHCSSFDSTNWAIAFDG